MRYSSTSLQDLAKQSRTVVDCKPELDCFASARKDEEEGHALSINNQQFQYTSALFLNTALIAQLESYLYV
ncbi:MAG: hypothetical protein LCH30_06855 [Proteobacteria bacterium]|nr:hypothetical protein [Pseudomonadota bacterium]